MANDQTDLDDLELSKLLNILRGDRSYYQLAQSVDGKVGEQTLIRLGDYNRPFATPVRVESLIWTARAINLATERKTSAWNLWVAHGLQFARTIPGFGDGRPPVRAQDAVHVLPPDWWTLDAPRAGALNRITAALVLEQHATEQAAEVTRLRAENEALRAQLAGQDA